MKAIYEVIIEGNDTDISNDISQILEQYLTNHQQKVYVKCLRGEE